MAEQETKLDTAAFYEEHYVEIFRRPLRRRHKLFLQDHKNDTDRVCRFCGSGVPKTSFRRKAHAVPEFLGNRSIFSLNECDPCNEYLAREYEDHLSKATLFWRVVARVTGKKGGVAYKEQDGGAHIWPSETGMNIRLPDECSKKELIAATKPFDFTLPGKFLSQPYVPLRAAMALAKVACSVVPIDELEELKPAIKCLMGEYTMTTKTFPVFYQFTPGPIPNTASEVILLRRKSNDEIPYCWVIIQFANHRLQSFVPGCPSDSKWLGSERAAILNRHFPGGFGDEWPFGKPTQGWLDWSSTSERQSGASATLQLTPTR